MIVYFLTLITLGRPGGDWLDVSGAFPSEDAAKIAAMALSDQIDPWTTQVIGTGHYHIAVAQVGLQLVQWSIFPGKIGMIRDNTIQWIQAMREDALTIGSEKVQ